MPQAPAKPIVKVVQKPSRGKTVVIIILAILAAALAGACAFLAINSGGDDPDGLEQAVVSSAWTWQSSVSGMLDEMEAVYAPFAANGQEATQAEGSGAHAADANAATADAVSEAEDAEASADTAEAEADAAAQAEADAQTEPDAEDAEVNVDAAAASDEADTALAEAEAMVEAAEDMTATTEGADAAALSQSLEDMGEAMGQLIGYSIALSALANEDQIQILDGPMQALREDHPDLVTAWDNLKSVVSGFITENLQDEENEAQGSSSAAAAQPDATTPDATAQSDSTAAPDMAAWEEFLNSFRVARDGFQQRAIEAGFTLA